MSEEGVRGRQTPPPPHRQLADQRPEQGGGWPNPDDPVLLLEGVWRYWGKGRKRWPVLRGVDLRSAPGTVTSIAGANGAGKTTLLRIATGMLTSHAGTVTIDGIKSDENWREYHRRIGFLSAGDRGLYARFSVRGHLDYVARITFIPAAEREQAIHDVIDSFGLGDLLTRRADRLSQGQRQRLRLALAFVHRPKVLLLDEPRNSLDAEGLGLLSRSVERALASGAAAIWCNPVGEEQPIRFDRSFVIEDGTLRLDEK